MKVGILTYYGVHSHGAVLQANALKTVLERLGHDVVFLRFGRNYDFIQESQSKKYKIGISSIPFYTRYLVEKGPSNILRNIQKNNTLKKYRTTHFKMGSRYSDYQGDYVVIGSDEVFSLEIGINPFMYGHGLKTKNIISYAGCFGPTIYENIEKLGEVALISSGFGRFKRISVRDNNSQEIVKKLTGITADLVCDPVILYGYQNEQNNCKPIKQRYVLVYSYDRNMNESSEVLKIKHFARKNGLRIFAVGYPHKWCDKYIDVSPDELIRYVKYADFVITDTFHGAVLSMICNTEFAVKLRGNVNKLGFLLQQYGLTERILHDMCDIERIATKRIDYQIVNNTIQQERMRSLNYLKSALK